MTLQRIFFFFLLIGAVLAVQGAKIDRPYQGHFSSYQLVMSAMARNMLKENFTQPLLPKTDLLVNGKRSLHLNQYPFPSLAAALGVKLAGGSFEFWGRFQSILCNLLSILLVGAIAKRFWDEKHAWVSMVIYAFSPFTLIYGQGFFSEPMALLFLLLSLFLLIRSGNLASALFSAFFFSLAVTSRIHWILFFPVFVFWIFLGQSKCRMVRSIVFSVIGLSVPVAWYYYTYWVGIQTDHLLTNVFLQVGMRSWGDQNYLLGLDYYRRILDVFSGGMLTPLLFPFFILGLFANNNLKHFFLVGGFLIGSMIAVLTPQKVMAHDFYLYGVFPFICWIASAGLIRTWGAFPGLGKKWAYFVLAVLYFLVAARYFYNPIFKQDSNQAALFSAAAAVQKHAGSNETVIVAAVEPPSLVYYMDRPAVTLDLTGVGKLLAPYLKNPKFTQVNVEDVQNLENAMKDPISWLGYLKGKGANYLVSPDIKALTDLGLYDYLEKHFLRLSSPSELFVLYKLESSTEAQT